MEYAIIAAGEGSRLKEEGYTLPKPLLPLFGIPMIERLIGIFASQYAKRIHIIVNSQSTALIDFLQEHDFKVPIVLYIKDTASSLHSLYELVKVNPQWNAICVTTTDTVFSERDFIDYLNAFTYHPRVDAYMGVTSFIDDESPLYVGINEYMEVETFADSNTGEMTHVSGGIYGLRRKALDCVAESVASGNTRMRNYQRYLLEKQLEVRAHRFGKIVDVDHLKDRDSAELFLTEIGEKPIPD